MCEFNLFDNAKQTHSCDDPLRILEVSSCVTGFVFSSHSAQGLTAMLASAGKQDIDLPRMALPPRLSRREDRPKRKRRNDKERKPRGGSNRNERGGKTEWGMHERTAPLAISQSLSPLVHTHLILELEEDGGQEVAQTQTHTHTIIGKVAMETERETGKQEERAKKARRKVNKRWPRSYPNNDPRSLDNPHDCDGN